MNERNYFLLAVLIIYLTSALHFTDTSATSIFHAFVMFSMALPLFGGMLADSFIGKFRYVQCKLGGSYLNLLFIYLFICQKQNPICIYAEPDIC